MHLPIEREKKIEVIKNQLFVLLIAACLKLNIIFARYMDA